MRQRKDFSQVQRILSRLPDRRLFDVSGLRETVVAELSHKRPWFWDLSQEAHSSQLWAEYEAGGNA